MNKFQERLQGLLDKHNLSRLQLSKAINVSHEAINSYFNKNFYPKIDIAKRLSDFFNCSLDYLFGLSKKLKCTDKNNLTFAETINKLLKDKNISIKTAMKDIATLKDNYNRWQKGYKPLTLSIIKLAEYFDVSVDFLASEFINNE